MLPCLLRFKTKSYLNITFLQNRQLVLWDATINIGKHEGTEVI